MNGKKMLVEAYECGVSHHQIYRPFNKLYGALRPFFDSDYFGVSAFDDEEEVWVPMHVNGASNPKPWRDRRGRRCRRTFQKKDLFFHLVAEPGDCQQTFRFFVNSPNTRSHLLGWDIDAKETAKAHEIACNLYHDCFVAEWDFGGHVFLEPSRNRKGRYVWTIIERTSTPAEFNMMLNALSRALRTRYTIDRDNKFDAIKGTLHYDSRDDLTKLFAESDGDINDNHRGVLVTMPLSGALARKAFEVEQEGLLAFLSKRKKRYVHAIPESHLRRLLELYGPKEAERLDHDIAKLRESNQRRAVSPFHPTSPSSTSGNTLRVSAPSRPHGSESTRMALLAKAHAETSGKNRMRFVSSLYFYTYGSYASTPEALVAFYKAEGIAKGEESAKKDRARLRRAQEALDDHKVNPAKQGYDAEYWLAPIKRFVTREVRKHQAIRYRSPRTGEVMHIEDELLAAGLCVLTWSAFAANRTDGMHSCSQEGQLTMYERLASAGILSAQFDDKKKRVAVPVMLQLAGLIVVRDAKWKFGGDDKSAGYGKKFGLAENHQRFDEFVRAYGHVVDPTSFPCIVNKLGSVSA